MKRTPTLTAARYSFPDPGELDKRIKIRLRVDQPVSDGGTAPEYSDIRDAWAKIRQVGATTFYDSAQTDKSITHYITIRHRSGITADCEVVHGDTIFRVRRWRDLNSARRFLLLECEELGSDSWENYG